MGESSSASPALSGPPEFDLALGSAGQYVFSRPGQDDVSDVRVRRAFPWSAAERFIAVRSKEGKELLLIEDLARVPPEAAARVRLALEATSFIPKIRRITFLEMRFGHQKWVVDTDRGEAAFQVQEREDVRFLPDGRMIVKDADGTLYELPPEDQLDEKSLAFLSFLI